MTQRILVVDDEPRNIRLLVALLEPLGHEVLTAEGGHAALEILGSQSIGMVLLDVAMPDIDGVTVLRALRAREGAPYVPVILVTAHAAQDLRLAGLEAGADEFLEKPIDHAILLARVNGLLRLKETQDELRAKNAALVRLERERQELTQFLVHDLKNPITSVFANLQFVQSIAPSHAIELRDSTADALEAMTRLQSMVDDLLVIAEIEQSELSLRLETFRLRELIDEVTRPHTRAAGTRQIAIENSVDPSMAVCADRALMRRVLENLTDNALRHTPRGGHLAFIGREGGHVEIEVANTGKVIPVLQRERIFDKFYRGEGSETRNVGLGLSFCQQVVRAHGGEIHVFDTPQWPTVFAIHLPRTARIVGTSVAQA